MSARRKILLGQFGGDFSLPYSIDFTRLPDGALPASFAYSPNWSISGGRAVCNPTIGAEISPVNMDFESAPNTGWTPSNATAVSSADVRPGSPGVASWLITATATNGIISKTFSGTTLAFVRLSAWAKAGTSQASLRVNGGGSSGKTISAAAWDFYTVNAFRAQSASIFANPRVSTSGGNAYFDDASFTTITGVMNGVQIPAWSYITARGNVRSLGSGNYVGLHGVFLGDSPTNPQNGIFVFLTTADSASSAVTRAYKLVSGGITALGAGLTGVSFVDGAPLEIRRIADETYQAFYNGVQIGTDITITEAAIKSAAYAGIQSSGGSGQGFDAFFLL